MYVWNKLKESLPICKYNCKWKCFVTRLELFSFQVENKMKWCHLLSNFPQKEHETKVKWENFVFVKKPGVLCKSFKVAKTTADDTQIQTDWGEERGGKILSIAQVAHKCWLQRKTCQDISLD